MATADFTYDVFLSHSVNDKSTGQALAERLRANDLRVWYADWEIKPGDNTRAKNEEGLEQSRVLVLCLSANALGAEWPALEASTLRFRDPVNSARRFVALRLDDVEVPGNLAGEGVMDWHERVREEAYTRLLGTCREASLSTLKKKVTVEGDGNLVRTFGLPHNSTVWSYCFSDDGAQVLTGSGDGILRRWDTRTGSCLQEIKGSSSTINYIVWFNNLKNAFTACSDRVVRMIDLESGTYKTTLQGHKDGVIRLALDKDQKHLVSAGSEGEMRLWDIKTGACLREFDRIKNPIWAITWSPDQRLLLSGGSDNLVRIWDIKTGNCLSVFKAHTDTVKGTLFSKNQKHVLSISNDKTLRVWNVDKRTNLRILEGSTKPIARLLWLADERYAITGEEDGNIRLWDVETGHCIQTFSTHIKHVYGLGCSPDGRLIFSGDTGGTICIWDISEFITDTPSAKPQIFHPIPNQVQYTNAKVLLVGNSAAGKTGLSNRLAQGTYTETDSTVGAWATQWKLPLETENGVEREIWLWDFGGQADQRLIHQLYMDQTHLAALVFDPQKEDLFDTLSTWDRDLSRAATRHFQKLLVAGRIDAGGLRSVSRAQVEKFARERGFARYLETSAKEDLGCNELKQAIVELIKWDEIAERSTPTLFRQLKEEIVKLKDEGQVLMRFNGLRDALTLRMGSKKFSDDELRAVITLLAGPGVVWELGFGAWILLQPELINSHAQAVIRSLREDEREIGCIAEEKVLSGDLAFPKGGKRLPVDEERIVLLAMHQILVERGLCLRDEDPESKSPTMLVFPSYARRERPDLVEYPSVIVSYKFYGFLDDIYATLVVRLHHTDAFERDQLWRDAADFKTMKKQRLGAKLTRLADGAGELEVYFDPDIPLGEMMIFSKYVHEHLLRKAKDVVRLRHYVCANCQTPVGNREVAMKRLAEKGKDASIICVDCEQRVKLWDDLEERFADPAVQLRVQELEQQSKIMLDAESKERILVGEVISTVGLAGQLCREFSVSDHGIDMEIEFKNDAGEATGKRLYLQLKSGDSYLRTRAGDGAEIFDLKKERHARYWAEQPVPVMLVIRTSDAQIRWMEVREHLRQDNKAKHIIFEGERFDVMSVRRWRDRLLA
ncbi:MAG: TIR domain-containing protein [Saprospiraceae bacterium]|nr:TIR domain-containing protein [Saprospiraceae bacterium]